MRNLSLLVICLTWFSTCDAQPAKPVLLTDSRNPFQAIAINSQTQTSEPFSFSTPANLSADKRTRLALFATGISDAAIVRASDRTGVEVSAVIEDRSPLTDEGLIQLTVLVPEGLDGPLTFWLVDNGVESNKAIAVFDSSLGPLPAAPVTLIFAGNSLTVGYDTRGPLPPEQTYPYQLCAELTRQLYNVKCENKGVGGITTTEMLQRTSDVDSFITPNSIVVVWEIGNDLMFTPSTEQQLFDHIVSYCAGRKAKGARVVVATVPWRFDIASDPIKEEKRRRLNARLRAEYKTFANDLADLDTDPRLLKLMQPDKVHYLPEGYRTIAFDVLPSVKNLILSASH